jgi:hypothetical protein
MIARKTFSQIDLSVINQFVYTHGFNTEVITFTLYDNEGRDFPTNSIVAKGDATGLDKPNKVTVSLPEEITGTWELIMNYQTTAEATAGRKAFELSIADPTDDYRVILGKELTPSINMTLTGLYAKLLGKLGFLKTSENLNDLPDKVVSRGNLGVYSIAQIDSVNASKATLLQTGSGYAIGTANTAQFKPTATWHPVTKYYSDNRLIGYVIDEVTFSSGKYKGALSVPTVIRTSAGRYRVTHNFNSLNYYVLASMGSNYGANDIFVATINRTVNYFDVQLIKDGGAQNGSFVYEMKCTNDTF